MDFVDGSDCEMPFSTSQRSGTGFNSFNYGCNGANGDRMDHYSASQMELSKRLLAAARDGNDNELRSLISRVPFTTDWLGTSPMHLAVQYGNESTVAILIKSGMSRDARTKVDKTPLHVAAQQGYASIANMLLREGVCVDPLDSLLMTPLHWAVERGSIETVESLLQYGANVNLVNKFDKTPLDIAVDNERPDIYEVLQNCDKYCNLKRHHIVVDNALEAATKSILPDEHSVELDSDLTIRANNRIVSPSQSCNSIKKSQIHITTPGSKNTRKVIVSANKNANVVRLLNAHGIQMLPEEDKSIDAASFVSVANSNTLTLTEAGKLALKCEPIKTSAVSTAQMKFVVKKVVTKSPNSDNCAATEPRKLPGFPVVELAKRSAPQGPQAVPAPGTCKIIKVVKCSSSASLQRQLEANRAARAELLERLKRKDEETLLLEEQLMQQSVDARVN